MTEFRRVLFRSEAKKLGMQGIAPEDMPDIKAIVRENWPTAVPLIVLLLVLFWALSSPPPLHATASMPTTVLTTMIRRDHASGVARARRRTRPISH